MASWTTAIKLRPRLNLLLSLLIGLALGIGAAAYWTRADSGLSVEVLGSGNRVSILITHDQRHILIASGSNGPEFSNALDTALTTLADDVDLVLIDPASSEDVIERAGSLDADLVLTLPGEKQSVGDTLDESLTVPLSSEDVLNIELTDSNSWLGTLTTNAGTVQIRSELSTAPSDEALIVTLDGLNVPEVHPNSVVIGPPGDWELSIPQSEAVSAGSVIRIDISGNEMHIDRP